MTRSPGAPRRRSSGVQASSARCTPRNHSGPTTSHPTTSTVSCGSPRSDSPSRTSAHTPSSAPTDGSTRRARAHQGTRERAAANPPAKKNSPRVWSTQVTGASSGIQRSGLSSTTPCSVSTSAVTSQWPSTTPVIAMARTASTNGSRVTGPPAWSVGGGCGTGAGRGPAPAGPVDGGACPIGGGSAGPGRGAAPARPGHGGACPLGGGNAGPGRGIAPARPGDGGPCPVEGGSTEPGRGPAPAGSRNDGTCPVEGGSTRPGGGAEPAVPGRGTACPPEGGSTEPVRWFAPAGPGDGVAVRQSPVPHRRSAPGRAEQPHEPGRGADSARGGRSFRPAARRGVALTAAPPPRCGRGRAGTRSPARSTRRAR
ncbi:hypothetical protein LV78_005968 [Actinosynnema pretiosum]|nr:hypothetical protein [Actinosynnema pretiosum]